MALNRKIKTLVLTDGSYDHASSRIRAVLYFDLLRKELNMEIRWLPRIPVKHKNVIFKTGIFPFLKRWFYIRQLIAIVFRKYDMVFVQRFFLSKLLIKILKKKKAAVIYDFDDAIYLDKPGSHSNLERTAAMLKVSGHIIVSTPELESFCHQQGFYNTSVITTPVDVDRFSPKTVTPQKPLYIGWIGSPFTASFLKIIHKPLKEVSKKLPLKLLIIGAENGFRLEGVETEVHSWKYDEEPAMLEKMDIGIMPLPDEAYARGKGGYKLFQYMAAGIPVIASPVGINADIVHHGLNGFLANNQEEWVKYITLLAEDTALRSKTGLEGRRLAVEKYSRSVCFEKLAGIIKKELS